MVPDVRLLLNGGRRFRGQRVLFLGGQASHEEHRDKPNHCAEYAQTDGKCGLIPDLKRDDGEYLADHEQEVRHEVFHEALLGAGQRSADSFIVPRQRREGNSQSARFATKLYVRETQ